MTEHPTPAELEAFVWNLGPAGTFREVMAHLAGGCEQCIGVAAPHLLGRLGMAEPPERILTPREDAAYDDALDRAFAVAIKQDGQLRQERKQEALALLASSDLEEYPEFPPYLGGIPMFEALLERSWALRHDDPDKMVKLSEWALLIAERFDFRQLSPEQRMDLRCRAWIELGNAYRVADNLAEAEISIGRATHFLVQGTGNDLLAARLLDIQASLFGALRRFDLADSALKIVFTIHRRLRSRHAAGRVLIKRGMYIGYAGQAGKAVRIIGRGLRLVDEERAPRLVFLGLHNQARLLLDCGQLRKARIALFQLRGRGLDAGGCINELKVRWLEGQIYAAMGELDRASQALQEVKEGFEESELGYKAGLAALELAAVRLRQGNTAAAVKEVVPAADMFMALGIFREAQASLLLLKRTFERKEADALLLDYVINLLRRGQDAFESRLGPAEE